MDGGNCYTLAASDVGERLTRIPCRYDVDVFSCLEVELADLRRVVEVDERHLRDADWTVQPCLGLSVFLALRTLFDSELNRKAQRLAQFPADSLQGMGSDQATPYFWRNPTHK